VNVNVIGTVEVLEGDIATHEFEHVIPKEGVDTGT
jgi:hypothetical protein